MEREGAEGHTPGSAHKRRSFIPTPGGRVRCMGLWRGGGGGGGLLSGVCTVPVRKKFPTLEYFFYGDTRSTKSSTRTTLLCYGRGIQRTAQYVSTLTTVENITLGQKIFSCVLSLIVIISPTIKAEDKKIMHLY